MKIDLDQVSEKKIVGATFDKDPIMYILTHGGLHCFFQKSKSEVKTLSMAPHKAVAKWMAEKAEPKIKWNEDMVKSEDLMKSDIDLYSKLLAYFATPIQTDFPDSPLYVTFNTETDDIGLSKKEDLQKLSYTDKSKMVVRNISLNSLPDVLLSHKDFR